MCSAYKPQPGESPTLPGDLNGAPEVDTPDKQDRNISSSEKSLQYTFKIASMNKSLCFSFFFSGINTVVYSYTEVFC